jgi:hypothetical protein
LYTFSSDKNPAKPEILTINWILRRECDVQTFTIIRNIKRETGTPVPDFQGKGWYQPRVCRAIHRITSGIPEAAIFMIASSNGKKRGPGVKTDT